MATVSRVIRLKLNRFVLSSSFQSPRRCGWPWGHLERRVHPATTQGPAWGGVLLQPQILVFVQQYPLHASIITRHLPGNPPNCLCCLFMLVSTFSSMGKQWMVVGESRELPGDQVYWRHSLPSHPIYRLYCFPIGTAGTRHKQHFG